MKKIIAKVMLVAILMAPAAVMFPLMATAAGAANWNTTGSYVININYLGTDYSHDMNLTQNNAGNLTGNGGSPAGANTYTWVVTSGSVSADSIDFLANYTATADAVTPQTVLHVMGTIAQNGTMSGTWSDNYNGGDRSGTWASVTGAAVVMPISTQPATAITATDAMLNGINGGMAATQSSFWVSTSAFSTAVPVLPPGVYSTADLGPQAASGAFSAALSSVVGMPAVTDNTTYYFAAWSNINGTWTAGAVLNFTTAPAGSVGDGNIGGDVVQDNGTLHVDSVTVTQASGTANGTFASGWKYTFHVTLPTDESQFGMKFADWVSGANILPVANNMRISSLQADNGNATVLLTAANVYSTPKLHMVSDLNAGLSGRQVDVLVEVSIPVGTPSGSYTTAYGIQTTP